jgi:uncharacterized protein YcnI
MTTASRAALGAALLCLGGRAALAHITLETGSAPVQSTYKAVLRVGHGCEGKPTTAIRVRIPEGVIAVKPMPKTGWQLSTVHGAYGKTYDYYGTPLNEGVFEIAWTGGNLPDDWYDEFVFRGLIAGGEVGSTIYFPVVQECPDGSAHRWIEIPEAGKSADDYDEPAPGVTITDKAAD